MANSDTTFKSFKWSKNTTLLLISLISQKYNQLQSGVKKFIFLQIAQEINTQLGTSLAYDQVESKWKGLKRTYIKMKYSKTNLNWEFYDQIDEILKDDTEKYPPASTNSDALDTKLDFVEYTIEPERSTLRQTRKRRQNNSDGDYRENEKSDSGEDVTGGIHKSRISKGKVLRREKCKDDSNGRGERGHRKECGGRLISVDDPNDYECRECERNHSCNESIEDARERRHQEKMKMAGKFLAIFERMVDRMQNI